MRPLRLPRRPFLMLTLVLLNFEPVFLYELGRHGRPALKNSM